MTVSFGPITIDWFGHGCVRLAGETGVVLYLDPGPIDTVTLDGYDGRDGDVILVTHADHYDPAGIERVAHDEAIVIVHESIPKTTATDGSASDPSSLPYEVEPVSEDETFVLGPLDLYTTPAYNEPDGAHTRSDGTPYHPPGQGCGYGVTIDGVTLFYPGDSDVLPIHSDRAIDVLLAPISGAVTMDRHEAADLAEQIRPDLVIPVHYEPIDGVEGTGMLTANADEFVLDVANRGVPVALDESGSRRHDEN